MIFLEAAPNVGDVDALGRAARPRQIRQPFDVGAGDLVLARLRLHVTETRKLLARGLERFLGHVHTCDALVKLLDFVVVTRLPQFLADRLELLAQHVLSLRLADLVRHQRRDLGLHLQDLELAFDHAQHQLDTPLDIESFQYLLAGLDACVLLGKVARYQIGKGPWLADVVQDAHGFLGKLRHQRKNLACRLTQTLPETPQRIARWLWLRDSENGGTHVRLEPTSLEQLEAAQPVEHDAIARVVEADDLDHSRQRADVV